jgi:hypothetical protein
VRYQAALRPDSEELYFTVLPSAVLVPFLLGPFLRF